MIDFKEIEIKDRELITSYTSKLGISYYSFTSLYIWGRKFANKYAVIDDTLVIVGSEEGSLPVCFCPIGKADIKDIAEKLEKELGKFSFMPLTADMAGEIQKALPGKFEAKRCEDFDDYIYNTEDLISLRGKKYHAKRNHINKFMQQYEYKYIEMTAENAHQCLSVEKTWLKNKGDDKDDMMLEERYAIGKLIENFDELHLKGAMIEIDGRIVAFSIGEQLREDMAHILIEKADISYDGLYALINREFAVNEWGDTTYINREEDMGEEGLRKAKRSYYPSRYNEIWCLVPAK